MIEKIKQEILLREKRARYEKKFFSSIAAGEIEKILKAQQGVHNA